MSKCVHGISLEKCQPCDERGLPNDCPVAVRPCGRCKVSFEPLYASDPFCGPCRDGSRLMYTPPAEQEAVNPKDLLGMKKPPLHLVPGVAIAHESLAMANGGFKYGPYNWRDKKVLASIYVSACMRHVRAWFDGEDMAGDSGVHHLGHARACLGILLDAEASGKLGDDRPLPGKMAETIAALENHPALQPPKKEGEEE